MTAGEIMLVVAGVLGALACAALVVTLVRVSDALRTLRREMATVAPLVDELRASIDDARAAAVEVRQIPTTRVAIGSGPSPTTRTTLSEPMIKASGLATGTSRAVRRLRRGA